MQSDSVSCVTFSFLTSEARRKNPPSVTSSTYIKRAGMEMQTGHHLMQLESDKYSDGVVAFSGGKLY